MLLYRRALLSQLEGSMGISVLARKGSTQQWIVQLFAQTSSERLLQLGARLCAHQLQ